MLGSFEHEGTSSWRNADFVPFRGCSGGRVGLPAAICLKHLRMGGFMMLVTEVHLVLET
jgi:hypothetical protein